MIISLSNQPPPLCPHLHSWGREEAEKQGIASDIALDSPCFSGDNYIQGFGERTTKVVFQLYAKGLCVSAMILLFPGDLMI
jgi:hypothetical protein